MLSGFVSDVRDEADNANRRAVVLNCRLFRRGDGWATRQERLVSVCRPARARVPLSNAYVIP